MNEVGKEQVRLYRTHREHISQALSLRPWQSIEKQQSTRTALGFGRFFNLVHTVTQVRIVRHKQHDHEGSYRG